MATIALHSAATGLSALSTKIDVIANNIANVNTTAFKSSRVNFEDLLYQQLEQPGVENANGDKSPAGIFVGLGVQVANTELTFTQGAPIKTDSSLDLMIEGQGFFGVEQPESPNGVAYTRAGNFFVNSEGDVVLGNLNGPRLVNGFNVPDDAIGISISNDGVVNITLSDSSIQQEQIEIFDFINPKGLRSIGGNLYEETEATGSPIEGAPAQEGLGRILQGFLESSNVDPVKELVELIKAQRAFELNSQSIQAADQSLQVINRLRR